ncbi:MAG: alpha/beta hydrolase fold domain-containing protein [Bacteroidetes bacterium]|nr:alpha/beta hydrolase fold domain-containing protein [Bacteroidota bacterium]
MKKMIFLLFPLLLGGINKLTAQESIRAFQKREFLDNKGIKMPYRILLPIDYDCSKKYPLLVFLHGSGERGEDNEAQLKHGANLFLQEDTRKNFQAIVVFPQCPNGESWSSMESDSTGKWDFPFTKEPSRQMKLLQGLLNEVMVNNCVDDRKVYLGGLSMGAFGILEWMAREPNRFAAAFPICGGGNTLLTAIYGSKIPTWFFHGDADAVVPVQYSRELVEKIKAEKGNVQYTEYPGIGHDSWNNAFKEPNLLSWLLKNTIPDPSEHKINPSFVSQKMQTLTYFNDGRDKLELDLYLPDIQDTEKKIPLILYVHGGGFSGGNRLDPLISKMAEEMNTSGYAFASISYRLLMKGKSFGCDQPAHQKIMVFQQSMIDVRRATAYLISRQNDFKLDMSNVILAGSSAGAEAILHTAYWSTANLPTEALVLSADFRYAGIISMAGALIDPAMITAENALPSLFFHGTCDALVPFDTRSHRLCSPGQSGYLLLHGAGELKTRHIQLNKPIYLVTYMNGGHEYASLPMETERDRMLEFIKKDVLGKEKRQSYVQIQLDKPCNYQSNFTDFIKP